ncbi:hypothetical protein EX895_000708 [Sporisorium graminicola]|uniref:Uncharacterized protein n=1 Tax=Sporisorium graminicola TaxID=280036 RepID=A0A4U7L1N6_9BASI|nr:hypothetical protein EX895_000708 [Sporisorium graminicola]TKY90710.1 hypothetical protein EX895_000708 [Sporisorium graminicola]
MSIETPAKRQRTGAASSSLPRKPSRTQLSREQRESIRHAKYLENGISVLEQLGSMRKGNAEQYQIAWSPHNVLATASNTRRASSESAGGHVVVQYPLASTSKLSLKPSCLYPDQPSFIPSPAGSSQLRNGSAAATTAITQTQPIRYDDPRHISFSPCGYYLCALFPAIPVETLQQDPSIASSEGAALLPNGLAPGTGPISAPAMNANVNIASSHPATTLSQNGDTSSASAATAAAAKTSDFPLSRPLSQLCFWSRAETGALNDWKLIQSFQVDATYTRSQSLATAKADNVLKVNDKGQPIVADGSRASPSSGEPVKDNSTLRGGVKQLVWLNRRRNIVLSSPSSSSSHYGANVFSRLAARGPRILPTASASMEDSGPDQDVALVVFGRQAFAHYARFHPRSRRAS